jgi:hypothetical protein
VCGERVVWVERTVKRERVMEHERTA